VQDAYDLDGPVLTGSIEKYMASATTVSGNVERAQSSHNLVPRLGPSDVGTLGKVTDRLNENVPIEPGLSWAEILGRPFEDIREVELCCRAESNRPFSLAHEILYSVALEMTFSERSFK
jgi:hypothetical protein